MSLFLHIPVIGHFVDPDSIASNAAFNYVYKCIKMYNHYPNYMFDFKATNHNYVCLNLPKMS